MSTATYMRYETVRLFRNRQNFIFSLVLPVVLYLFIAGQAHGTTYNGIPAPTYLMAGMIAFGGMVAMVGGGARISFERATGWTRQLRISPLSPRAYFRTKLACSYVMACVTIAFVYAAGLALGVRMSWSHWAETTGLLLVGLIPFAALGIMLGHLINSDSMGPIMGGGMSLLSIIGGAFGPLGDPDSVVTKVTQFVPSYWIVQAGHTSVGGSAWGAKGWLIVAAWSVLLTYGAVWAYRRDTGRI